MELELVRELVRESPLKMWGNVEVELADFTPPPLPSKRTDPRRNDAAGRGNQLKNDTQKTTRAKKTTKEGFRRSSICRGMSSASTKRPVLTNTRLESINEEKNLENLPRYMWSTASSRSRRVEVRRESRTHEKYSLNVTGTVSQTSRRSYLDLNKDRKISGVRKVLEARFVSKNEEENLTGQQQTDDKCSSTNETTMEFFKNPEVEHIMPTEHNGISVSTNKNTHELKNPVEECVTIKNMTDAQDAPLELVEVNENMPPLTPTAMSAQFQIPRTTNTIRKTTISIISEDQSPTEFFTPIGYFAVNSVLDPKETPVGALCTNLRKLNLDEG